jgi:nucleoside-diphosphate-sugar epimerase
VINKRSFVACDNLVDLLVRLLQHPQAAGTWLVSDGEDLSTAQLLRLAAESLDRPARLFPMPPTLLAAVLQASGRIELAHSLIGSLQVDSSPTRFALQWKPPVTAAEAIKSAAVAFRARHPRR